MKKSLHETMSPNPLVPLMDAEKETIEGNKARRKTTKKKGLKTVRTLSEETT